MEPQNQSEKGGQFSPQEAQPQASFRHILQQSQDTNQTVAFLGKSFEAAIQSDKQQWHEVVQSPHQEAIVQGVDVVSSDRNPLSSYGQPTMPLQAYKNNSQQASLQNFHSQNSLIKQQQMGSPSSCILKLDDSQTHTQKELLVLSKEDLAVVQGDALNNEAGKATNFENPAQYSYMNPKNIVISMRSSVEKDQVATAQIQNVQMAQGSNLNRFARVDTMKATEVTPGLNNESRQDYQGVTGNSLVFRRDDIVELMSVNDESEQDSRVSPLQMSTKGNPAQLLSQVTQHEQLLAMRMKRTDPNIQISENKSYPQRPFQSSASMPQAQRTGFVGKKVRPKTLFQKSRHFGQDKKSWVIDNSTGNVTVRQSSPGKKEPVNVQASNHASSIVDSKRTRTIETPLHTNDRLFSQRYAGVIQAQNAPTDSSHHPGCNSYQRLMIDGEDGQHQSTLQKGSGGTFEGGPTSSQLVDSPKNFTQMIQLQKTSGHKLNEPNVVTTSNDYKQSTFKQNSKPGPGNFNKRYGGGGHKRVQSANPNSKVPKSRSRGHSGLRSFNQTGCMSVPDSNMLQVGSGTTTTANPRQSYNRHTLDQGAINNAQVVEGRNFTMDFSSPGQSLQSSRFQQSRKARNRSDRIPSGTFNFASRASQQTQRMFSAASPRETSEAAIVPKGTNPAQVYHQHKMAEQLLLEEEQMAVEQATLLSQGQLLYRQLVQQAQQDPETLLRRDGKKGTTASLPESEIMDKIFAGQKYDPKQNSLLTKNPMIIRKEKVANQNEFNQDTAKAILEILSKKSAADKLKFSSQAILAQTALYQMKEQPNIALQNTNVGDINLLKDATKEPLFDFLGRLQGFQSVTQLQPNYKKPVSSANTARSTQHKGKMNQGQITQTLLNQTKKRRLWSSSGHARSSIAQKQGKGFTTMTMTTPNATTNVQSMQQQRTGNQPPQLVNEHTKTDLVIGEGETRNDNATMLKPQESGDVIFEGAMVSNLILKQVYNTNTVAYDSHQSTIMPTDYQQQQNQVRLKASLPSSKNLAASIEIDRMPPTTYKNEGDDEMRQSLEPMVPTSNVQVQSIQIALQKSAQRRVGNLQDSPNHKQLYNMALQEDDSATASQARKALQIAQSSGLAKYQGGQMDAGQHLRVEDGNDYTQQERNGDTGSSQKKRLEKSNSSSGKRGLLIVGNFKNQRKRCQSAHFKNKQHLAGSKSNSNSKLNLISNENSASDLALEVKGKNISSKNLPKKISSLDNSDSPKKLSQSKQSIEQKSRLDIVNEVKTPVQFQQEGENESNMVNTIVPTENDPRSPQSNNEDPTPYGYRKEYLTFQHASNDYDHDRKLATDQKYTTEKKLNGDKNQQEPSVSKSLTGVVDKSKVQNQITTKANYKFVPTNQKPSGNQQNQTRGSQNTAGMNRRRLQDYMEQVNTDLIICESSAAFETRTSNNRAQGFEGGTLSTIMEPQRPSKMTIAENASTVVIAAAGNQSALSNDTKKPVNDSDQNVQLLKIESLSNEGEAQVQQPTLKSTLPPKRLDLNNLSRNVDMNVQPQFSANSTVKMDLASQNENDARDYDTGVEQLHKIISPDSQMGKVFQKTNLSLHQRNHNARSSTTKQTRTGQSPREGIRGEMIGVALTDFNSKLKFERGQYKVAADSTAIPVGTSSKTSRTQANLYNSRRLRNKSRFVSQTQHNHKAMPSCYATQGNTQTATTKPGEFSDSASVCRDCQGLRGEAGADVEVEAMATQISQVPSQTQFVISTMENLQGRMNLGCSSNNKVDFNVAAGRAASFVKNAGGQPSNSFLSPSEQQLVIEQLQELPIELTQQLNLVGSTQQSCAIMISDQPNPNYSQTGPVKIMGHKSLHSRKKGLSLVSYPKSFLQGPRNTVKTHSTPNTSKKRRSGSKNIRKRQFKTSSLPREIVNSAGTTPPLSIVNSQTMIMSKRKLIEATQKFQDHRGSSRDPIVHNEGEMIRYDGIQPKRTETQDIEQEREVYDQYNRATELYGNNHHSNNGVNIRHFGPNKVDLMNLNEQSNQYSENSVVKELDSSRAFNQLIAQNRELNLSTQKQSADLTIRQSPAMINVVQNHGIAAIVSSTNAKDHEQQHLSLPEQRLKSVPSNEEKSLTGQPASKDDVNSQHNRSTQRRNIMSRQSSAMSRKPQLISHEQTNSGQHAQSEVAKQPLMANQVDDGVAINQSMSSNLINALDADSDRRVYVGSHEQLQHVAFADNNNTLGEYSSQHSIKPSRVQKTQSDNNILGKKQDSRIR